jgi:N-acetylmuramoyl-L-alanine amidase
MYRRTFIKLLSQSAFVSYGLLACPVLAWSKSAFDLALEGQDLIQKKDFPKAIKALQEAVRMDPESDWAFGLLGRAYLGLDQKAEAVAAFRQAVRLNPADTYSRMMIEITTQKPIPRPAKKKKPLTPLEKEAMHEEQDILKKLRAEKGLGYKVKRVVIDAGHGGFDPGAVGKSGLKSNPF